MERSCDHVMHCSSSSCEGNAGSSNIHNQCYLFWSQHVSYHVLSDFISAPLTYTYPKQCFIIFSHLDVDLLELGEMHHTVIVENSR